MTRSNRQHQILRIAIEHGYYEVPRRAIAAKIAHPLECAPSTASEHLRKIEAHVLSHLIG